jgi:preprotein translocase SecE subunit
MQRRPATGTQRPPLLTRIRQFLIEAWFELRKVLWPSKEEAIRFTLVVLAVIAVVALFIYICDMALTQLSGPLFNLRP